MEELVRLFALTQTERFTLTELYAQFGISRKTGYKLLKRVALGGIKALAPRFSWPLIAAKSGPYGRGNHCADPVRTTIAPHMGAEEASRDAGDQARHRLATGVQHDRRGAEAPWPECVLPRRPPSRSRSPRPAKPINTSSGIQPSTTTPRPFAKAARVGAGVMVGFLRRPPTTTAAAF